MGVKTDLTDALRSAIKEKDDTSKNAIRLALSAIKLAETEKCIEKNPELDDVKIFSILQKEIKIREETIAEAVKADREGMVEPLKNEIKVIDAHQMTESVKLYGTCCHLNKCQTLFLFI